MLKATISYVVRKVFPSLCNSKKLSLQMWYDVCWWRFIYLTLIDMRGDTFSSLSISDQSLSAEFLSKISKLFWGENWHQSGWFDTLPSSCSLIKMPLDGAKDEHFSCFHSSCQWLRVKSNTTKVTLTMPSLVCWVVVCKLEAKSSVCILQFHMS